MNRLRLAAAALLACALGACAFEAARDDLLCDDGAGADPAASSVGPCAPGLACVDGLCQPAPVASPDAVPAPARPDPPPFDAAPPKAPAPDAAPPPPIPPALDAAPPLDATPPDAALSAPVEPVDPVAAPGCPEGAVCLSPSDDAFHTEAAQWFAGGPALEVVEIDDGPKRKAYVRFDLTGLPPGVRWRSARLSLYIEAVEYAEEPGVLRIDVVSEDWSEADVFGRSPPVGRGRLIDLHEAVTSRLRPGTRLLVGCGAALDRALREGRPALAVGLEARDTDAVRWRFRSKDAGREPPLLVLEPE